MNNQIIDLSICGLTFFAYPFYLAVLRFEREHTKIFTTSVLRTIRTQGLRYWVVFHY
jgi:hypothetical protein